MLDLVFVLDGSRPITPRQFSKLKEAVLNMLDRFIISDKATHVGIIEYSSSVNLVSPLNRNNTAPDIKNILSTLQPSRGYSRITDDALRVVSDRVFSVPAGGRPGASRVLVILTHGKSTGDKSPGEAVKPLKDAGVNILVVNIGRNVDPGEAEDIATSSDNVFPVDYPDKVPDVADNVVDKLTKDLKKSKTYLICLLFSILWSIIVVVVVVLFVAVLLSSSTALAKRMQHCYSTSFNVLEYNTLSSFGHRVALCCILLHLVASCCILLHLVASCCILLHLVASCCILLYDVERSLISIIHFMQHCSTFRLF